MPRFIVPRSSRTMKGTVTPWSVVVVAMSLAGVAAVQRPQHEVAEGTGFGSAVEHVAGAAALRKYTVYSVAMLQFASGRPESPLARVVGVVTPSPGTGTGVAQ